MESTIATFRYATDRDPTYVVMPGHTSPQGGRTCHSRRGGQKGGGGGSGLVAKVRFVESVSGWNDCAWSLQAREGRRRWKRLRDG